MRRQGSLSGFKGIPKSKPMSDAEEAVASTAVEETSKNEEEALNDVSFHDFLTSDNP